MPKELDFDSLRFCLDHYTTERLYIRDCGGYNEDGSYRCQGLRKVDEFLQGRILDFRKDDSGLYMIIDSNEVFHFPLNIYHKGFCLAYERIQPSEDGIGRMVYLSHGENPDDENLPEPRKSFLRIVLDDHLMEIYFTGKIQLRFHSWFEEPYWKYWVVCNIDDKGLGLEQSENF